MFPPYILKLCAAR
jgi:hypothetical protein